MIEATTSIRRSGAIEHSEEFWELAMAANAAIKGLLGYLGQSGHVCERTIAVPGWLDVTAGGEDLLDACAARLVESGELAAGDIVVLAEKPLALAQGRVVPRSGLGGRDPKCLGAPEREALAGELSAAVGGDLTGDDLVRADWYEGADGRPMVSLGATAHNEACAGLARRLHRRLGFQVDVVISDTDTGLDVRAPVIGTLTLGATPLGATGGLTLYECMRCAVAAEFERGHTRHCPLVICRPARRCADRAGCGLPRGYGGRLDRRREAGLTYA